MFEAARPELKDFFISYNSTDRPWAEWIAWQAEEEGYSVILQVQDIQPGETWAQIYKAIRNTRYTVIILSPDYQEGLYKYPFWIELLRTSSQRLQENFLISVQVREGDNWPKGLLSLLAKVDLVGKDEDEARELLLACLRHARNKTQTLPDQSSNVEHAISDEQPPFPFSKSSIWNVPERNRFFSDREAILHNLHNAFASSSFQTLTRSMALCGLGGIGKTQIAIEYAYRYQREYQAVLWAPAGTRDNLVASYLDIARQLDLPQKDEKDHDEIIEAVKDWLQDYTGWLLILDNADDLSIVRDFLPTVQNGHVLITTRAQASGRVAKSLVVEKWRSEEGRSFLLRRIGMLELDTDDPLCQDALRLVGKMDGLPLALDQAGAYIEETKCSIADYFALYRQRRHELLSRRGELTFDHPEPVATAWTISFERVQHNNAAAALLRLFAFLAADEIPEELITESLADVGSEFTTFQNNPLAANDAIAELRKYSLIQRDPGHKMLSVHRLVQAVLRDTMPEQEQHRWAELAVCAVSHIFPEVEFKVWAQCQRYLPHARVCASHIERWALLSPEAAQLLHRAGAYLHKRARYADAEALLRPALTIYEKIAETGREGFVQTLNDLANLYQDQGKYEEAEQFYQRALSIIERFLSPEHNSIIETLNNLSTLYEKQGRYTDAALINKRVQEISDKSLDLEQLDIAMSLSNQGWLYRGEGKYEQAEPLLQRALAIRESILGPDHPDTAISLSRLGWLYQDQGKYQQAEVHFQRALAIDERALGSEHPNTLIDLNNLANLYQEQGKYPQATPLFQRALAICEQVLGPDHPDMATSLHNLGRLYTLQENFTEAEPLYRRALSIREQVLGPQHSDTEETRHYLISSLVAQLRMQIQKMVWFDEAVDAVEHAWRLLDSIEQKQLTAQEQLIALEKHLKELHQIHDKQAQREHSNESSK